MSVSSVLAHFSLTISDRVQSDQKDSAKVLTLLCEPDLCWGTKVAYD